MREPRFSRRSRMGCHRSPGRSWNVRSSPGLEEERDLLAGEVVVDELHHAGDDEEVVVVGLGLGALRGVEGVLGGKGVEAVHVEEALDHVGVEPVDVDPADGGTLGAGGSNHGVEVVGPGGGEQVRPEVDDGVVDGPGGRGGIDVEGLDAGDGPRAVGGCRRGWGWRWCPRSPARRRLEWRALPTPRPTPRPAEPTVESRAWPMDRAARVAALRFFFMPVM